MSNPNDPKQPTPDQPDPNATDAHDPPTSGARCRCAQSVQGVGFASRNCPVANISAGGFEP